MRIPVKQIIVTFKSTNNVSQTASLLGISRPTVYRWIKRGRRLSGTISWHLLERKSTKPKAIHHKIISPLALKILSAKQAKHFGAKKLKRYLKLSLSASAIHRFLKRKNLVAKQVRFRRPLFQNGKAMRPSNTFDLGYLQMDTKHVTPELSGLPFTVYEYAAIDIASRYKLAVILPDISPESARMAIEYFLKWFPFRVIYVQTDNGLEFQGEFETFCQNHHLDHYFIHKNSPNENAVIERSFKTDQDEFYYWLEKAPQHLGELNEWLQKFIQDYNTDRPHQSLDYKTPLEFVKLQLSVTKV
jgi:putative transposase